MKEKGGARLADVALMTKIKVYQKQLLIRTNLDETISIVSPIGWNRKYASDFPFPL